jgi:uncharacterized protein YndB with AHSA1/START domain
MAVSSVANSKTFEVSTPSDREIRNRTPDGGVECYGEYREIVPPDRLVLTDIAIPRHVVDPADGEAKPMPAQSRISHR